MKILFPAVILLTAALGAAAAWFLPIREEIRTRPAAALDAAGKPVTAQPLSPLTPEERAKAEELRAQVDALDAKLDAHDRDVDAAWAGVVAALGAENARRGKEGERIAGVVNSTGVKGVESQVEDMMDETARKRVMGVVKMWLDGEVKGLKKGLALSPQQSTTIDQIVEDILKEERARVDAEGAGDNLLGWRNDLLESARGKLHERVDPLLTADQKARAQDYFKDGDWGRAWREGATEDQ